MVIYRVMDEVFRSWSHVAVLRAIIDRGQGCTGNEVARISGMHPRSAIKALSSLEALGIVNRLRGGRDHLFSLNREHVLVLDILEPLYKSEGLFFQRISNELIQTLKHHVVSTVVFGSVAKKEENPQSDFDLCCIVNVTSEKSKVRELINKYSKILYAKYGIKTAPVIFTIAELKRKKYTRLVKEIINYGITLKGKNPRDLVNGQS